MNTLKINPAEIDEGVKDLVQRLNEVPFVTTRSSCEGHLRDYFALTSIKADKDHKFLQNGHVTFDVDSGHQQAPGFLEDVTGLKDKYYFVDFYEHQCGHKKCTIEGSYFFILDYLNFRPTLSIEDGDTLVVRGQKIKGRHQVEASFGQQIMAEYQKVWADLSAIAKPYAQQNS